MTAAEPSDAQPDWPQSGEEFGPSAFGPFAGEDVRAYAAASGDNNPLHLDEKMAKAAGLDAPPIHGMLMMSCFEPALTAWRPDLAVAKLSAKFLRPVLTGQSFTVSGRVVRSATAEQGEVVVRLTARGADNSLTILGEAVLCRALTA
jgi:acyl dehydratase